MKLQLQFSTIAAAAVLSLSSAVAWAHFGIVIPEHSAVLEQKDANVHFTIAFAHPILKVVQNRHDTQVKMTF